MTIATVRRKSIKVGERRSALIELPKFKTFHIQPSATRQSHSDLFVEGWVDRELFLSGLWAEIRLVSTIKSMRVSSPLADLSTYEFSADFRHCEETVDGYEFFNEDDTV
jgi:hypothetical protein